MKSKKVCPYCRTRDCVPGVVFLNCENYANESFTVKCEECHKVISVYVRRVAVLMEISKSDKKEEECDFPN